MKAYLAGPGVFLADAIAVGEGKKARRRAYGIEGLYPLDPVDACFAEAARRFGSSAHVPSTSRRLAG